jgi:hypothetical protein
MKAIRSLACALVVGGIVAAGCAKKEVPVAASSPPPAPAPAPVAVPATAATTAVTAAPVATASTSTPAAASASTAETTSKLEGAEWALRQEAIKNDADGQWAMAATASSTYGDAQGSADFSANQSTGAPNVEKFGDDGKAWASKTADGGIEWLDLKYPKSVHATAVRIRESCAPGAVIRVELYDETGAPHLAWGGNDPTTGLNDLIVNVPKTEYKTDRVKVTLATNVVPGWNEIDAIQLVGKDQ